MLMRPIRKRMPVLYDRLMGRAWLEQSVGDELELLLSTQPVLSELLEAYEVSTLVNSPENDSPECVRRLPKAQRQRRDLPLLDRYGGYLSWRGITILSEQERAPDRQFSLISGSG
jgi:hypothetical protein